MKVLNKKYRTFLGCKQSQWSSSCFYMYGASVSFSLSSRIVWPDWAAVQATHLLDATKHISLLWEPLIAALSSSPPLLLLYSTLISSPRLSSCNLSCCSFLPFFSFSSSSVFAITTVLKSNLSLKTICLVSRTRLVGVLTWTSLICLVPSAVFGHVETWIRVETLFGTGPVSKPWRNLVFQSRNSSLFF